MTFRHPLAIPRGSMLVTLLLCLTAWTGPGQAVAQPLTDPRARAVQILVEASGAERPLLRMNAVEAVQYLPERAGPIVGKALYDDNPAVRWAAMVTAGRLGLVTLGPQLLEISRDEDQELYVRAAAAFAAHRCGLDADLGLIAQLLWDPRPGQRANAALLLRLLDEPSAIPVLRDAARDPMPRSQPLVRELFRLQVAEALVALGEEESLPAIRGAVYSNQDEVRILAVIILGRCGDRGMTGNLVRLLAQDPMELRLAAADSLARLGNPEGLPIMLYAAARADRPTVRAQAAFALGKTISDPRAAAALQQLFSDPDASVRIAAAAAWVEADAQGNAASPPPAVTSR